MAKIFFFFLKKKAPFSADFSGLGHLNSVEDLGHFWQFNNMHGASFCLLGVRCACVVSASTATAELRGQRPCN